MKTKTVELKMEKAVNEHNEVQPNVYTIVEDGVVVFSTTDALYALQAFLNRS